MSLSMLETRLLEALEAARDHLEYCGYGDSWERECAEESKLAEKIAVAISAAKELVDV